MWRQMLEVISQKQMATRSKTWEPRSAARLSVEEVSGTVSAWKGEYGWIKPAQEIQHETAAIRNGALFCSMDDCSQEFHLV